MPIVSVPQDFNEEDLYVDLLSIFGQSLFLKCEGFNFAGSIKVKAATEMVEAAAFSLTEPAKLKPSHLRNNGRPRVDRRST